MLRYEIKKILARPSGKLSLLVLVLALGLTCWFSLRVGYVNGEGETEYGLSAVRQLRTDQKAWAGPLDEETLRQAIQENNTVNQSPEAQSEDIPQQNVAFGRKQGFYEIRQLLSHSFANGLQSYDYYTADGLTSEDAPNFYINRVHLLQDWLDGDAADRFSPQEKAYLLGQYQSLDTPFYMDYFKGWTQLFDYSPTIIMVTALVLGFLSAGIFSCEAQWKTDAIFFTSVHGRNKGTSAKVKAGFCLVTAIYWVTVLLFSLIVLGYLGFDGASCPIQAYAGNWKSLYNITLWQEYLLIVVGGYLGCLVLSLVTMLVSAKTNSTVLSATIPFILIFLPALLLRNTNTFLNNLLGILPDRLLQMSREVEYFDLYQFGDRVVPAVPILLGLYTLLALLLPPILYQAYKRKQVR